MINGEEVRGQKMTSSGKVWDVDEKLFYLYFPGTWSMGKRNGRPRSRKL